jgi:hypothetical protein
MVLGIPSPPGLFSPFRDPRISDSEKPSYFIKWATTYYNSLSSPSKITTEALISRYDMYKATNGDAKYLRTSLRMSEEKLSTIVCPENLFRMGATLGYLPQVYDSAFRRAVFDTRGLWNHVRVVALWADMSVWSCSLSSKVMADMLASPPREWEVRRPVEMIYLQGVNHMVSDHSQVIVFIVSNCSNLYISQYHYDEPEGFLRLIAGYV